MVAGSEPLVIRREGSDIDGVVGIVGDRRHIRHSDQLALAKLLVVGNELVLDVSLRVHKLRTVFHTHGHSVSQVEYDLIGSLIAMEVHLPRHAEEEVGGSADEDVAVGSHESRVIGGADCAFDRDGA